MQLTVEHTVKRLYTLEVPDQTPVEELREQLRDRPWDWEEVYEQTTTATAQELGFMLSLRH